MYKTAELQVFIHSPNQLVVSLDKPKYRSSFERFTSSLIGKTAKEPKVLEFKISQVKQLRKRSDSNIPCSDNVEDYDAYYQEQIVKKLGCVPPYWRNKFKGQNQSEECSSPTQIENAHLVISDPKSILKLKEFPCNEMILMSIDSINYEPAPRPKDISIAFFYTEKTYEEIQYSRMMGFESWLSNVGGFSGIFLGYSMMQIPNFLVWIISLFHQKNIVKSKLDSIKYICLSYSMFNSMKTRKYPNQQITISNIL